MRSKEVLVFLVLIRTIRTPGYFFFSLKLQLSFMVFARKSDVEDAKNHKVEKQGMEYER